MVGLVFLFVFFFVLFFVISYEFRFVPSGFSELCVSPFGSSSFFSISPFGLS